MNTTLTTVADGEEIQWHALVSVPRALKILGLSSLSEAASYGPKGRAFGAWDANEREAYAAWKTVATALLMA